jgi:hypothetical protein
VQARLREVNGLGIGEGTRLVGLNAIEKCSSGISSVWILIGKRAGSTGGIPLLTGSDAGVTSNAHVQINYQSELFTIFSRLIHFELPAK